MTGIVIGIEACGTAHYWSARLLIPAAQAAVQGIGRPQNRTAADFEFFCPV